MLIDQFDKIGFVYLQGDCSMCLCPACEAGYIRFYNQNVEKYGRDKVRAVLSINEGDGICAQEMLDNPTPEDVEKIDDFIREFGEVKITLNRSQLDKINELINAIRVRAPQVAGYDKSGWQQKAFEHGWISNADRLWAIAENLRSSLCLEKDIK